MHFIGDPGAEQGRGVVDANRRLHLRAGTLLLRDLGATDDAVLNLPEDDGLPLNEAIAACVDKVKVRDPKHGSTRVREALDALVRYGYLVHSGGLFNLPQ